MWVASTTRMATSRRWSGGLKYDVLGRLEQRTVPQVHYSRARVQGIPAYYRSTSTPQCTGAFVERTYPSRPNDGGCGYRIEEDVQTFRYDAMGNVTLADNRDAQIRREYNLDGTLRIESLRIRTMHGTDFSRHEYGLEFRYDLNGRRIELKYPAQLAATPAQATVAYGYDPATTTLRTWRTTPRRSRFRNTTPTSRRARNPREPRCRGSCRKAGRTTRASIPTRATAA